MVRIYSTTLSSGTPSNTFFGNPYGRTMFLRVAFVVSAHGRSKPFGTYPLSHLYGYFGLVRLTALGRDVPWAKA
jgi:hypothetical protein